MVRGHVLYRYATGQARGDIRRFYRWSEWVRQEYCFWNITHSLTHALNCIKMESEIQFSSFDCFFVGSD